MFRVFKAFLMGASLFLSANVYASLIVDTGTPIDDQASRWGFGSYQYFAGEFSIAGDYSINAVEGYLGNERGRTGNIDISVHSDAGNVPGAQLFTAQLTLESGSILDWYGVDSLNWLLSAGTYWVSFVPDENINGDMWGVAPSPLDEYAAVLERCGFDWCDDGPDVFDSLGIGLRVDATQINAVSEPGSMAIFGLGLVLIFGKGKKSLKELNNVAKSC